MAANDGPPSRSRIDELLALRKQTSSRQRLLDNLTAHILTQKVAEIMQSDQGFVMEHVAELLQRPTIQLQKLFLLQGLTLEGATALCNALPQNKSLSVFKILHGSSGDHAEEALQMVLQKGLSNSSITELVLNDCVMAQEETVSSLLHTVQSNTNNIQRVSIVDVTSLGRSHAARLGGILEGSTNNRLKQVKLIRCGIDPVGAASIANALQSNTTVNLLNLEGNPIGNEGAISLADALKHNQTLQHLLLCRYCGIGNAGATALGHMLPHNRSLLELDLSGNPDILIQGKEAIVEGLQRNATLCSTGMRVTRRHPLRPTVLEQMQDLLTINAARQQWNSSKDGTGPWVLSSAPANSNEIRVTNNKPKKAHLSSGLLPFYLAKVSSKPCVLYLSLRENGDLFLPYL